MRHSLLFATALAAACAAYAAPVDFDSRFDGRTLRLDYILGGNDSATAIFFDEAGISDTIWAGRRHNLERPHLRGNGAVWVIDAATGDTIYANSFSNIFQEWQVTPEAAYVARAFEATMLVPMPREKATVSVELYNNRHETVARLSHPLDPADIMIRQIPPTPDEWRYVHLAGTPAECIDIAILAEGYTAAEKDKFYADAERAAEALLSHEPFSTLADKINIIAVASESGQSGPAIPREGIWGHTAYRSHYDTFYTDRYLTTQAMHSIHDHLAGIPAEHIVLLVNTPRYGGGGIFNQVTVATSDHPTFKQVLVHEFGHAYAGLADEYFYTDNSDGTYPVDIEPWEPNITTLVDFSSKWADMVPEGTQVPTPLAKAPSLKEIDTSHPVNAALLHALTHNVGVYEGAGYKLNGVYRPVQECRMKVNEVEWFCPVCSRAILDISRWYLEPVD